jgi:hypothetical protein
MNVSTKVNSPTPMTARIVLRTKPGRRAVWPPMITLSMIKAR